MWPYGLSSLSRIGKWILTIVRQHEQARARALYNENRHTTLPRNNGLLW